MKKCVFISMLLTLICATSNAQVEIKIKVLQVASLKKSASDNMSLHAFDGPYVLLTTSFKNTSNKELKLHPSNSKAYLIFNYDGKEYIGQVFGLEFSESDTISIKPNEEIEVTLGSNLLLGTSIMDEQQIDYTDEMLEILPTLDLVYKEGSKEYKSCEIERVIVK